MTILIFGKTGQLAQELLATQPQGTHAVYMGREETDITCLTTLNAVFERVKPQVVINAAAYTAVDKAESDAENAFLINATATENIAQCCAKYACKMLHVSTDFIFGSTSALNQTPLSQNSGQVSSQGGILPLTPQALAQPLGVYGASKYAGEQAVLKYLGGQAVIVRTAWVYSVYGHNFVKTMLNLMAAKPRLNVIADQIGAPTWAKGLAQWLWAVAANPNATGIHHYTDAGVASWYDFAVAIQQLALEYNLLTQAATITPIPTTSYPTPAKRPSYSVLNTTSALALTQTAAVHWRAQLSDMLAQLKKEQPT